MNILKPIKPLFMERGNFSLGRISYWFVLGVALKVWTTGNDIGLHLLYFLAILLFYSLGKKGMSLIKLLPFAQEAYAKKAEVKAEMNIEEDGLPDPDDV